METRERILVEAREVLLENGLNGFSMRGVADRVGVSATALYRHFEHKDALLASLLEHGFTTFANYLVRALAGKTPLERFRLTGLAYFDFALEHPRDYELMFMTSCRALGFDKVSADIKQRMNGTFVFLVDRTVECMKAGVFAERDPHAVALSVWADVHGLASLWLSDHLSDSLDLTGFRQSIDFMLDRIEWSLTPRATS
jgi:AcrR family transcriptional regulator